jgi:hypothetical protein
MLGLRLILDLALIVSMRNLQGSFLAYVMIVSRHVFVTASLGVRAEVHRRGIPLGYPA